MTQKHKTQDELNIHLNDWVLRQQNKLKLFVTWWQESAIKKPREYPLKLQSGEWEEQFNLFEDAGKIISGDVCDSDRGNNQ